MKLLRNYQLQAVKYLRKNNGGALFVEMRLGKTLISVRFLKMRSAARRVIIVAPYSTFEGWLEENAAIKRIDLHAAEKVNYFETPGWYIVNKEEHLRNDFLRFQWDAIILDESFIRNPKAKVTKYILRSTRRIPIRMLLTGTPAPENDLQYYTQLEYLFPGVFGTKSYWEYRAKYARPRGFDWCLTNRGMKQLETILREKCFVLRCKDVNLYPTPVHEVRSVYLSKESRKNYIHAERDCMDELDNVMKFSGQRWNYLRRLCGGKEKETELLELLKGELAKKQVVIWCFFVEEVKRIAALLKCPYICGEIKKEKRDAIRRRFQVGDHQRIVIQPEVVKYGSDLSAADTQIYFSTPAGGEARWQSEKRIISQRRSYPILTIDLVVKNTVEEDIMTSLAKKETAQQLLERVRNAILARQR